MLWKQNIYAIKTPPCLSPTYLILILSPLIKFLCLQWLWLCIMLTNGHYGAETTSRLSSELSECLLLEQLLDGEEWLCYIYEQEKSRFKSLQICVAQ